MRYLIYILISFPFMLFSQEKGSLSIELNSGYNLVSIPELEKSMNRVFVELPNYITIINRQSISSGISLGLNANYQIGELFSVGVYSKYLTSKSENDFRLIVDNSFVGFPDDTLFGLYTYNTSNSIIGLYSTFDLSNLNFWSAKDWLSNIESKIEIGLGYSFSQFYRFTYTNNNDKGVLGELNTTSGVHLRGSLKIGYRLKENPVFLNIGIQIGYQCLMTRPLQAGVNSTFKDNAPRLGFTGVLTGIYLTFGK